MSIDNVKVSIGNSDIAFETGKLALQAPGSVLVTSGETNVLVTTVANKSVRDGIDFFPLTVDVEERMYSAGKIPGGFFRREGRQTEKAILACRLIDRPLRPSFKDGFRCETQIIATVLSVDNENEYDILALNAASLGLQLAGVPLESAVGAVRMSLINDTWIAQATNTELEESVFDMVVAGSLNSKGEVDIVMVEAGASDDAFEKIDNGSTAPSENIVADGIDLSKEYIAKLIEAQKELVSKRDVPVVDWPIVEDYSDELKAKITDEYYEKVDSITALTDRSERSEKQSELQDEVIEKLSEQPWMNCHFDFERRNLIAFDNEIAVIDFQDLSSGPIGIDLAGIIIDHYIKYPDDTIANCLDHYSDLMEFQLDSSDIFEWIRWGAIQRNMRILGTLSSLYLDNERTFRLKDLPMILSNLIDLIPEKYESLKSYLTKEVQPQLLKKLSQI